MSGWAYSEGSIAFGAYLTEGQIVKICTECEIVLVYCGDPFTRQSRRRRFHNTQWALRARARQYKREWIALHHVKFGNKCTNIEHQS